MPGSTDDFSEYLATLQSAASHQQSLEARKRQEELEHAQALAALKAQQQAEEERLLRLRSQAAEAEKAAQEVTARREAEARAAERAQYEAEQRAKQEIAEREARARATQEAAERAKHEAEQRAQREAAEREAKARAEQEAAQIEAARREAARIEQEKQRQQTEWTEKAQRQWDETAEEYARCLEAYGAVEVGRFRFRQEHFDLDCGRFRLPDDIAWHPVIPATLRPRRGLQLKADRELARAAVAAGELPLLGTLAADDRTFAIRGFLLQIAGQSHALQDRAQSEAALKEIAATMVTINPAGHATLKDPYAICQFPVTQSWYEAITGQTPSHFKGPRRPVEQVSWEDAAAFCRRLNELAPLAGFADGLAFALPTEAQWEYACRAGSQLGFGLLKNGCAGTAPLMAWTKENSGDQTHGVGQLEPNAWDLHDMHGNVLELCEDCRNQGRNRAVRGGNWNSNAAIAAVNYGGTIEPGFRNQALGFRLARRSI